MSAVLSQNFYRRTVRHRGSVKPEALFTIGFPLLFLIVIFVAAAWFAPSSDCEQFERPEAKRYCEQQAREHKGPLSGLKLQGL